VQQVIVLEVDLDLDLELIWPLMLLVQLSCADTNACNETDFVSTTDNGADPFTVCAVAFDGFNAELFQFHFVALALSNEPVLVHALVPEWGLE
jgi:hypothetical protein